MSYKPKNRTGPARRSARMRKIERIRARDGDLCSLCGIPLDFRTAAEVYVHQSSIARMGNRYPFISLDHQVPRVAGGTYRDDNVRLAHKPCNGRRNDRPVEWYDERRMANWMPVMGDLAEWLGPATCLQPWVTSYAITAFLPYMDRSGAGVHAVYVRRGDRRLFVSRKFYIGVGAVYGVIALASWATAGVHGVTVYRNGRLVTIGPPQWSKP